MKKIILGAMIVALGGTTMANTGESVEIQKPESAKNVVELTTEQLDREVMVPLANTEDIVMAADNGIQAYLRSREAQMSAIRTEIETLRAEASAMGARKTADLDKTKNIDEIAKLEGELVQISKQLSEFTADLQTVVIPALIRTAEQMQKRYVTWGVAITPFTTAGGQINLNPFKLPITLGPSVLADAAVFWYQSRNDSTHETETRRKYVFINSQGIAFSRAKTAQKYNLRLPGLAIHFIGTPKSFLQKFGPVEPLMTLGDIADVNLLGLRADLNAPLGSVFSGGVATDVSGADFVLYTLGLRGGNKRAPSVSMDYVNLSFFDATVTHE